jgi:hypothetical protein
MTKESAARQLKRLDVFPHRQMSDEAVLEYLGAIMTANDESVAAQAIGDMCRYGEKFPCPAEIVRAILSHRERSRPLHPCGACGGTGYVIVDTIYKGNNLWLQQLYGGVPIQSTEPCRSCCEGKVIQRSGPEPQGTSKSSSSTMGQIDMPTTRTYERVDEPGRNTPGALFDDVS